ncbi:serine/threonine-protein kinase [Streptomyces sp. SID3343]|uniref:serine/threonine-protein kinase n=1 Tax=Streptomyces sp. SID3343 TaxID=2690260 RepID=UPI0013695FBC|nr:serine/threonine-protein kinase [Streptomyces sp. SID3343]MYW03923.1 PQQ-binding-like beta-propeller repeat protein [Streptomyces sp. SID3343]
MEELRDGDPARLGSYRLRARLGEGGMGEVFLGVSPSGVRVAVKTVRPEFVTDHGFRDRFRREIDLARRVDSAWTAPIAEADPDAEHPWLATEYLTGLSLSEAIDTYGPLPEGALRILGAQLTEALMAIHRAGLIHRDLKPSNVILGRDRVRVIDFGISRAVDEGGAGLTGTGRVVGSPSFMSPEQASGRRLGSESDVFSLGSVLVFAGTGAGPFHGEPVPQLQMMMRVLNGEPNVVGVPAGVRDLVLACLHKDPADRPGLAEILARCLGDSEPPTGSSWLPTDLAAELERRHVGEPGVPRASPADASTRALPVDAPADAPADPADAEPPAPAAAAVSPSPGLPATRNGPPPQPSLPPTVGATQPPTGKRALGRRAFLIGGSAVAVVAAGGGLGWFLMGDAADPGNKVWDYPVGAAGRSSLGAQGGLVFQVSNGAGGGYGLITAVDAESGKKVWSKATTGRSVSEPMVTPHHVLVVSWSVEGSGRRETSAPAKCTVHAFDPANGEQRWSLDFDARWVRLPTALDKDVLYLGVAAPNEYGSTVGRIVAIDVNTHAELWKADMLPDITHADVPVPGVGAVYCMATSDSGSLYGMMLRAFETGGRSKWDQPLKDYLWGVNPLPHGDRVLALVTKGQVSGRYTWDRYAFDPATGAVMWGPVSLEGGSAHDIRVFGADTLIVAYSASSDRDKSAVVAIDATTGGRIWKYEMPGRHVTEVTWHQDVPDTMFVACYPSGEQAGVQPSGTTSAAPSPDSTESPMPRIDTATVYALDLAHGTLVWERGLGSPASVSRPVLKSGKVYVTVNAAAAPKRARVVALDAENGRTAWDGELPVPLLSEPLLANGKVYVAQWQDPDARAQTASLTAFEA